MASPSSHFYRAHDRQTVTTPYVAITRIYALCRLKYTTTYVGVHLRLCQLFKTWLMLFSALHHGSLEKFVFTERHWDTDVLRSFMLSVWCTRGSMYRYDAKPSVSAAVCKAADLHNFRQFRHIQVGWTCERLAHISYGNLLLVGIKQTNTR